MNEGGMCEFAMVITVPADRLAEWEKVLRRAVPPPGIHMNIRTPSLLILQVQADMEFIAIEKAGKWLNWLAGTTMPPISLGLNPQPAEEV